MESNNRKKKLSMTSALLVVAMISLVGVGFATVIQGQAVVTDEASSSDYIVVSLGDYDDFIAGGVYSVDSMNTGTIALSNLKKDNGSTIATVDVIGTRYVTWSGSSFALSDSAGAVAYKLAKIGTLAITLNSAQTALMDVTITGTQASSEHQYGLSLIYIKDNAICNPATVIEDVANGSTITIDAYVVYSATVPVDQIASIGTFAVTGGDVTVTARPA